MSKPRLLDLFCGAGGAARGYQLAGFEVVGVDIVPQPRYAGDHFRQADVMEVGLPALLRELGPFDAVHASPPCQDWSQLHRNYGAPEHGTAGILTAILGALQVQGLPWVLENVVGARLPSPILLCGASFGLGASGLDLNRHRLFQVNCYMLSPPCQHRRGRTVGVYGKGTNAWHRAKLGRNLTAAEQREAMGIDWMTRQELSQAIPPAYTEWIGLHLPVLPRARRPAPALDSR